jgi:hypothetical protein
VGLCHRGLADISEHRQLLDEALTHRETSLGLIATALDPHESQVCCIYTRSRFVFCVSARVSVS